LSIADKNLIVTSTGRDPHLSFRLPQELDETSFTLHFEMTSDSRGNGEVFSQEKGVAPAFFRDRSTHFEVQHDGEKHEYSITFSAKKTLTGIRIDPSTGSGTIRISNIRLTNADGKLIHQWDF